MHQYNKVVFPWYSFLLEHNETKLMMAIVAATWNIGHPSSQHFIFLTILGCFVIHELHFNLTQKVALPSPKILTTIFLSLTSVARSIGDNGMQSPNWQVLLDCFIYSLDCQVQQNYAPHPFNFWNTTFESPATELEQKDSTMFTLSSESFRSQFIWLKASF